MTTATPPDPAATPPAPCCGACEDGFTALVAELEEHAAGLGFELQYAGLRCARCGKTRASSTTRRQMRVLLIHAGAVDASP